MSRPFQKSGFPARDKTVVLSSGPFKFRFRAPIYSQKRGVIVWQPLHRQSGSAASIGDGALPYRQRCSNRFNNAFATLPPYNTLTNDS